MKHDISQHNRKFIFRFKDKKIIINKLGHESEFQPFAKALAYFLYHKKYPTIRVEAELEDRFQPDLCAIGYDGTMLLWVECGKASINKIEKLFKKYRQAHFVFIKEEKEIPTFKMHLEKRFKKALRLPLVDIVVYPEHFHDWYVSEEGDVFIPSEEVTTIRWHGP
ncbi:MAG TPA: YaeQ family protein [Candidatus Omnitrophota bacterium]|nr:YaeQ family protein [Candidatus Omnitrophota bacterium]